MKNAILWAAVVVMMSGVVHAGAETLNYAPARMEMTVAAGGQVTTGFVLSIADAHFSDFFVWSVDRIDGGNLPSSWIKGSPVSALMKSDTAMRVSLTVSVPAGTSPGTYTGTLYSRAMASHIIADPGTGITLEMTVIGP